VTEDSEELLEEDSLDELELSELELEDSEELLEEDSLDELELSELELEDSEELLEEDSLDELELSELELEDSTGESDNNIHLLSPALVMGLITPGTI